MSVEKMLLQPTNMLRAVVTILLFFVYSSVFAQKQKEYQIGGGHSLVTSDELDAVRAKLDWALVAADTVVLKQLLHKNVFYGHSNGWIQNKREVIEDLYNGKIDYVSIEVPGEMSNGIFIIEGVRRDFPQKRRVRTVNSLSQVAVTVDGKYLEIKLSVTQVWIREKGRWQLLARQSTKIN